MESEKKLTQRQKDEIEMRKVMEKLRREHAAALTDAAKAALKNDGGGVVALATLSEAAKDAMIGMMIEGRGQ